MQAVDLKVPDHRQQIVFADSLLWHVKESLGACPHSYNFALQCKCLFNEDHQQPDMVVTPIGARP
jgi:hypothetical protein